MNSIVPPVELSEQLHKISDLEMNVIHDSVRLLEQVVFNLRINLPLIDKVQMETYILSLKELACKLVKNIQAFERDSFFDINVDNLLNLSLEMESLVEDYCQ